MSEETDMEIWDAIFALETNVKMVRLMALVTGVTSLAAFGLAFVAFKGVTNLTKVMQPMADSLNAMAVHTGIIQQPSTKVATKTTAPAPPARDVPIDHNGRPTDVSHIGRTNVTSDTVISDKDPSIMALIDDDVDLAKLAKGEEI